mgnify:CR=1 FL=1
MLIGILAGLYCRIDEFLEVLDQCYIRLMLNIFSGILRIFNKILLAHSISFLCSAVVFSGNTACLYTS